MDMKLVSHIKGRLKMYEGRVLYRMFLFGIILKKVYLSIVMVIKGII
jgi:hypothetical protein